MPSYTRGMEKNDRLALKEGDIVTRKFRGNVDAYVVVGLTASREHFWVRDLRFGNDGFYDENHDLTEPKWSVFDGNVEALQ